MKHLLGIVGMAAALTLVSPALGAVNLVVDGDFSAPDVSGSWGLFPSIPGWTNAAENAIEIGTSTIYGLPCANAACQQLEVNANTFGDISQTISGLVIGDAYALTYLYGGRPGGGEQVLDVSIAGASEVDTGSLGAWATETIVFVALSTSTVLEFKSVNTSNLGGLPSYGNEITNVSVSAVPEASSWAMMLAGFAELAIFGRRRETAVA